MAAFLRRIVAGPRAEHAETGLDLCYVTSNIIATSGPSQTYPQLAYRNPLDRLVAFLDAKHEKNWAIWEFRAEGTGYPDNAVYNRIRHYPWPDHHPPPFRLVPMIVESMHQWLQGEDEDGTTDRKNGRVVVVHCKAGKGRSGTMACSYLISEYGWSSEEALNRFTQRRMRPGFGSGITIPSQVRWIGYVERWARQGGKRYVDRPVEIVEIHVWGLRHGVKLAIEGYVDEGKKIHVFHTFGGDERFIVEGNPPGGGGLVDLVSDMAGAHSGSPRREAGADKAKKERDRPKQDIKRPETDNVLANNASQNKPSLEDKSRSSPALVTYKSSSPQPSRQQSFRFAAQDEPGGQAVIFKPKEPIRIPNSDVNVCIERRNRTAPNIMGLTMVTSVAHVWFNAYFEGNGPEQDGQPDENGVFDIDWEKLDGIKGSSQKGSRAADRLAVVWRAIKSADEQKTEEESVPKSTAEAVSSNAAEATATAISPGEVPQMQPADWRGGNQEDPEAGKSLGLRKEDPDSGTVSKASSVQGVPVGDGGSDALKGVKTTGPGGEALASDSKGSSI
ncbi:phosphatidylinositol-trisphosphate 3-phosphatase pten [Grosmannia clavigera kw1407]|uniref:phosphatidylinositol-3,4,5-trisphosphate 3-phosphatase n=1 Tax=Grosmannia clavigera (strain kw1407 / UAMH 11150) TaxID=655863 RepID=F0XAR1_GROCL|nr:phosphatidylinositol-trisphosphate 3-phosphatase pten [Grosmannia clavigera kw1407]EFX05383.1 phosphatidylinositol-trisphosphate 3-phosphatase pten [Grosmannia clavigera kw1407]